MGAASFILADQRGALALCGPDARSFLQGLVSNDVTRVAPDRAVYAAFLTPQGRYLHDFFIVELDGVFYLDCEAARRADLLRRLSIYRLRSKIELRDSTGSLAVALAPGREAMQTLGLPVEPGSARRLAGGGIVYVDPRLADLGARALVPRETAESALADAGLAPTVPRGSYFALADVSRLPGATGDERAMALLERAGVASVPGTAFWRDGEAHRLARFCFGKTDADLAEACRRLRNMQG